MRRALRYGIRLGLLGGIAFALFRILDARRSKGLGGSDSSWPGSFDNTPGPGAGSFGSMASPGPGPVPAKVGGLGADPPDPDLIDPVMLTSVAGVRREGDGESSENGVGSLGSAPPAPAKRVSPAKKSAPAKKAASVSTPPVKKAAPAKKAASKKPAPGKAAGPEKP